MDKAFKRLSNPIMLVGDNPSFPGGLSRIGLDLATLLCTLPQFRVSYLARGCGNNRRFPFTMYDFDESGNWGERHIESAWNDFSGGDFGIIMTTDDLSRRGWFSNPKMYGPLATFLGSGRQFQKWAYTPLDSTGPDGVNLGIEMRQSAAGYDRLLSPSEWGRDVLIRSGFPDADFIPHGVFMQDKFRPIENAKSLLGLKEEQVILGVNMSNQSRKDWPTAFECIAVLRQEYGNKLRALLHVDVMIRHWNLYALATDYGVQDCIEVTSELSDDQLALRYSACDCTILPSAAEGFGYPIAESMACGTACVVTDYAAGQELVPEECRVRPVTYRVDTIHNVRRAVLSGYGFAAAAKGQIEAKRKDWTGRAEELREQVLHLDWQSLKTVWQRWFLAGLK